MALLPLIPESMHIFAFNSSYIYIFLHKICIFAIFYKYIFRIVFFISSWISDEGTSAVKLYASIADCMNEVIDLLSNNTVSSI